MITAFYSIEQVKNVAQPKYDQSYLCYDKYGFIDTIVSSNQNQVLYSGRVDVCGASQFRKHTLAVLEDMKEGDIMEFHFQSQGGLTSQVESMVETVEIVKRLGIDTVCVAGPIVASAAIDPYLTCHQKVGYQDSGFVIHPITIKPYVLVPDFLVRWCEDYMSGSDLDELVGLSKYPEMEEAIRQLYYEDRIVSINVMIELGFVDGVVKS